MKTFSDYTILCTPEQTKKALELGAQIQIVSSVMHSSNIKTVSVSDGFAIIPTAEQMRGWLMEKLNATTFANKYYPYHKGFGYLITGAECVIDRDAINRGKYLLKSDKEATLEAIDAALHYLYLANNKK